MQGASVRDEWNTDAFLIYLLILLYLDSLPFSYWWDNLFIFYLFSKVRQLIITSIPLRIDPVNYIKYPSCSKSSRILNYHKRNYVCTLLCLFTHPPLSLLLPRVHLSLFSSQSPVTTGSSSSLRAARLSTMHVRHTLE